ncbi:MAG TPA: LysE family transporter, partial [Acidimicrobiales bacterium]|nr:LysE family transporter [Acidimicrobiales bacterium]
LMAARRAFRSGCAPLASSWRSTSVAAVAAAALAFTWLNPAAYFDTIVLVGTVANTTPGRDWWFGGGAAIASMLWFVSLGFGAQFLAPLFAHARSWRALDAFTAVVMVGIGLRVLLG